MYLFPREVFASHFTAQQKIVVPLSIKAVEVLVLRHMPTAAAVRSKRFRQQLLLVFFFSAAAFIVVPLDVQRTTKPHEARESERVDP